MEGKRLEKSCGTCLYYTTCDRWKELHDALEWIDENIEDAQMKSVPCPSYVEGIYLTAMPFKDEK